jgi:hypothetical protein
MIFLLPEEEMEISFQANPWAPVPEREARARYFFARWLSSDPNPQSPLALIKIPSSSLTPPLGEIQEAIFEDWIFRNFFTQKKAFFLAAKSKQDYTWISN